jgi:hypothetical protein
MAWTRQKVKNAVLDLGYTWFETGNYNLNIVGIRNSLAGDIATNKFDDFITVSYLIDGEEFYHEFRATCDPGLYWMENLINPDGTAILVPGQYLGSHQIGMHRGQYEALIQVNPVKVFRDNNRDQRYDMDPNRIKEGIFGINIHRATKWQGAVSNSIDKWSAGCQVLPGNDDFTLFMQLCNNARDIWGNSFTYTLLESNKLMEMDYLEFQAKQNS